MQRINMFDHPLQTVGFALRHAQWSMGDEPGPITPMLLTPGTRMVPDIVNIPRDIDTNLPILRVQRDTISRSAEWTVLLIECALGSQDAFSVEWTWRATDATGMVIGTWERDGNGFVSFLEMLDVVHTVEGTSKLHRPGDSDLEALSRGMQDHADTVEQMVPVHPTH